jgi:hypothetical protein
MFPYVRLDRPWPTVSRSAARPAVLVKLNLKEGGLPKFANWNSLKRRPNVLEPLYLLK